MVIIKENTCLKSAVIAAVSLGISTICFDRSLQNKQCRGLVLATVGAFNPQTCYYMLRPSFRPRNPDDCICHFPSSRGKNDVRKNREFTHEHLLLKCRLMYIGSHILVSHGRAHGNVGAALVCALNPTTSPDECPDASHKRPCSAVSASATKVDPVLLHSAICSRRLLSCSQYR